MRVRAFPRGCSYIGCPYPLLATDGIAKCTAYLNNNPAAARVFSSVSYTATALDVKSTVDVLTDWDNPNQRVFVMGSSNGAYLAQRYMQVAPTQADAIILDALLPPDLFRLVRNEYNMNTLGLDVMARCAADDGCRQKFNGTYGDGGAEQYVGPMQALETLKLSSSYGDVPCLTKLNATYMQFAESWANQLCVAVSEGLMCGSHCDLTRSTYLTLVHARGAGTGTPGLWSRPWCGG